jgi:glycosyltransferase involved in cell wall biosynthesis
VTRPVRVLHVVGAMNRGGTETWLLHVLRNIDRESFQFDFLVHTEEKCAYDEELERLGARVIRIGNAGNPAIYCRKLFSVLCENGPYDVIHSHVHYLSGLVTLVARIAKVPARLAHGHCDTRSTHSAQPIGRKAYRFLSRCLLNRFATTKLAVSEQAGADLFGEGAHPPFRLLSPAVDLGQFCCTQDGYAARAAMGVAPTEFVIGSVGRLISVKNHVFLIELLPALIRQRRNATLLIAGEGPFKNAITDLAVALGVESYVRLIGPCNDVPRFLSAVDVFVMPSLSEGFGLAAVEAQAAGVPTILSDRIPRHVDLGAGIVRFLSLESDIDSWVEAINDPPSVSHSKRRFISDCVHSGPLSLAWNVSVMKDLYTRRASAAGLLAC